MTMPRVVHYADLSAEYLRKARHHLADGDLPQASEKAWGATTVALKACAETRDLPHDRHHLIWPLIRALVDETGDEAIQNLFPYAESLHGNFYENRMEKQVVEDFLGKVEELVARLQPLA